jgi:predicted MFS family arabinose efflux permease
MPDYGGRITVQQAAGLSGRARALALAKPARAVLDTGMTSIRPHIPLLAALAAANFVVGVGAFGVVGILEPLAADLGLGPGRAGALMTTFAIAYAVLSPVLVSLTGAFGRRRVMAAGLVAIAAGSLMAALAPSEAVLHLARIVQAAGAGVFTPVATAVGAGLVAPAARGRALGIVFMGMTLAQVAGIPAASYLAYSVGWRPALFAVAIAALPMIWLVWRMVPRGLAFQVVQLADLARVARDWRLVLALAFTVAYMSAAYVLYTYLAPLLSQTMGFGRDGVALALLIYGFGAVPGSILGGWLGDRVGAVRALAGLAALQLVFMPALSALPLPLPLLGIALFGWSICGWSFLPPQQARLIALAPPLAPVLISLNAAGIYLGAAIGSAVGGVVIAQVGVGGLGLAAAGMVAVALGILALSARQVRG